MADRLPTPTGTLRLADGRDLSWDEHGPTDGPAVFYLHGIPGCRVMWSGLGSAAESAGVRLIVPDRPGCGLSSFQPDRRITDLPSDLSALADQLRLERYWVAGVSGGGPYALATAAAGDPRLVGAVVTNGVGPLHTPDAIAGLYDVNRPVFEAAATGVEACRPIIESMTGGTEPDRDALAAILRAMPAEDRAVIEADPRMAAEVGDLRPAAVNGIDGLAYDLWLAVQPWGFDLTEIAVPVDFYAADHDRNVPIQHAVDQAALVPNSTLTVWPASGHFSGFVRLPEVLAALARTATAEREAPSTAGNSAHTE
ncbi:alpha/beta fold hydrolase [Microlunatus soli]|uniref:Pimeloyl-ACP methyl ester carboxylesterase n=1 Tax=Microlunatus soli TaxID=630515 RepID=A0A1H1TCG3_9ACTN|nr:alpha/beta hydrolase [Microlunatus soli]SDS57279.1 Pimeloyl-ACP methyl ester carboxylesterase [Microlunatus soli]